MSLQFNGSDTTSIGVEIELQIVDPTTWDLTPKALEVLAQSAKQGLSHVKAEIHQSMLEVDTQVSRDVKECRACLQETLSGLVPIVEELGLRLSVSGTHPFQNWPDRQIYPNNRYLGLEDKFRWLVKRMNVYGMHVHVGVSSAEKAVRISAALTRYLPHLLALSANSPFWHGSYTGMQACRPNIIESFPSGGISPYLENWRDFEEYYDTLAHAKVISSPKDLYWYIRPNLTFGTIEFRISDAMASLDDLFAVVALTQTLVKWMDEDATSCTWDKKRHWIAPENILIAARDGLDGMIITDLSGTKKRIADEIHELVDTLSPLARQLHSYEELQHVKHIISHGNGATHQLNHFLETQSLQSVVSQSTMEFLSNFTFPRTL